MPGGKDIASHCGFYESLKTASQKLQPSPDSPSDKWKWLPAPTLMAGETGKEARTGEGQRRRAGEGSKEDFLETITSHLCFARETRASRKTQEKGCPEELVNLTQPGSSVWRGTAQIRLACM